MDKLLQRFRNNHKKFWIKDNVLPLLWSCGLFIVALVVQKAADNYVIGIHGIPVDDIFLNYLPTVDIDAFIIQSALAITFLALFLFLYKPQYLSFGLKALAVFIIVRSFLITLTHLGSSPQQLVFDKNIFDFGLYNLLYNSSNDFFFSGHTGTPFLLALVFWPEKLWRYLFIVGSVVCGISVLLAHIHYSIDVFAAPFITYSIFALSREIFPKAYTASREP